MWGGEGGRRSALGGEVGFQLQKNLWLSAGYNVTGFADRDLVSSNFTTRGMFVRLRMKFDESVVPASATGGRSTLFVSPCPFVMPFAAGAAGPVWPSSPS